MAAPELSLLQLVRRINSFPAAARRAAHAVVPLVLDGKVVGIVPPATIESLSTHPIPESPLELVQVSRARLGELCCAAGGSPRAGEGAAGEERTVPILTLRGDHALTREGREQALARVCAFWRQADAHPDSLRGWRGELYTVAPAWSWPLQPVAAIERAAVGLLGIPAYGVHINGYVRGPDAIKMWIARRSMSRPIGPGRLDNTVAGGLTFGLSPSEVVAKECGEEASIPPELAAKAVPVGAISYVAVTRQGWCPETQFTFDLELPPDFVPKNADGEVAGFYLWSVDEVIAHLKRDEFKDNCGLVVIEFLLRHGLINSENEPDFMDILRELHRDIRFATILRDEGLID